MRLPRPSRAQLGAGALVLAALSVGRVVTEWLPDGPSPVRPFERHVAVGETAKLRYADVKATRVDGGKQLSTPDEAMLSPCMWVVVEAQVTPTVDHLTFGYAELRTADGAVLTDGNRNIAQCRPTNPGIPTHCIYAFEIAAKDLPGATLALGRAIDDQRGDDMAVIDLDVSRQDVDQWAARTKPVTLRMPDGTTA